MANHAQNQQADSISSVWRRGNRRWRIVKEGQIKVLSGDSSGIDIRPQRVAIQVQVGKRIKFGNL